MRNFEYGNKYAGDNVHTVVKREDVRAFQLGGGDPAHIKAEQKYIRAGTLEIDGMTAEEALKAVKNPELVRDKTFLLISKEGAERSCYPDYAKINGGNRRRTEIYIRK